MSHNERISPIDRLDDEPRIMKALQKAAALAMLEHKRAGVPVATWEDGQVVWIQPEDIPIAEDLLEDE